MNIPATLATADLLGAHSLKTTCFECVFVRGKPLLSNPAFESMPQPLLLELFRDFATRRTVSTKFAKWLEEEEEDDDDVTVVEAAQQQQGGKRRKAAGGVKAK